MARAHKCAYCGRVSTNTVKGTGNGHWWCRDEAACVKRVSAKS